MKRRRMRIVGRVALTEQIGKGRNCRSVLPRCVGYRVGDEVGEYVKDRLVLGRGTVVEARARRVHLEVAVQKERQT